MLSQNKIFSICFKFLIELLNSMAQGVDRGGHDGNNNPERPELRTPLFCFCFGLFFLEHSFFVKIWGTPHKPGIGTGRLYDCLYAATL